MLTIFKEMEELDVDSLDIGDAMLLKEYVEALKKKVDDRARDLAMRAIETRRETDPNWTGKSIETDGFMITETVTDKVSLEELKKKRTSLYERLLKECFDAFSLTTKGKNEVLVKTRSKWLEDAGEKELHITAPELQKVLSKRIQLSQGEVDAIMDDCVLTGDVKYTITRKAKAGAGKTEEC